MHDPGVRSGRSLAVGELGRGGKLAHVRAPSHHDLSRDRHRRSRLHRISRRRRAARRRSRRHGHRRSLTRAGRPGCVRRPSGRDLNRRCVRSSISPPRPASSSRPMTLRMTARVRHAQRGGVGRLPARRSSLPSLNATGLAQTNRPPSIRRPSRLARQPFSALLTVEILRVCASKPRFCINAPRPDVSRGAGTSA